MSVINTIVVEWDELNSYTNKIVNLFHLPIGTKRVEIACWKRHWTIRNKIWDLVFFHVPERATKVNQELTVSLLEEIILFQKDFIKKIKAEHKSTDIISDEINLLYKESLAKNKLILKNLNFIYKIFNKTTSNIHVYFIENCI